MALIDYKNVEILRRDYLVLKDVSFQVGEASLLKTMYADVPIVSGEAEVLGYDLINLKRRQVPALRRRIGVVFQDFQLLTDRSVEDNLDFVLRATGMNSREERAERIRAVLDTVGMTNKAYKMPHELSGGEQQRVVIARAMLNTPSLILADEPTGNLDPETGESIFALLNSIASEGTSVLIATHNHSLIDRYPGRVLLVEDHLLSELP